MRKINPIFSPPPLGLPNKQSKIACPSWVQPKKKSKKHSKLHNWMSKHHSKNSCKIIIWTLITKLTSASSDVQSKLIRMPIWTHVIKCVGRVFRNLVLLLIVALPQCKSFWVSAWVTLSLFPTVSTKHTTAITCTIKDFIT